MGDEIVVGLISSTASLLVGGGTVWATLKSRVLELDAHRRARHEAETERDRLRTELFQTRTNLDQMSQEHSDLVGQLWTWTPVEHHVILDGARHSGKSTLIMRWANPTISFASFAATAGVVTIPMHLCSELNQASRTERRHQLHFHDVAGEEGQYLRPVMDKDRPEVAILMIDPTRLEASRQRFTHHLLRIVYGDPEVVRMLRGILIYVSKADEARQKGLLQPAMELADSITGILAAFYRHEGSLRVQVGDARTNEGVVDALGFVAEQIGVKDLLPKHPSSLVGTGAAP